MYPFGALLMLAVTSCVCQGLHGHTCNVFPKDQYIERGSDTQITCQTSCVHGKIYWTLDNISQDKNLSERINSSHTVLSLKNFTNQSATLQCHSEVTKQVLGGTTIRSYTKPIKVSCILHYEYRSKNIPDFFTCSWEHQSDPSFKKIKYTVLCESCPSKNEICSTYEETCTSPYTSPGLLDLISLRSNASVTVRATSGAWNASSEPYTFYTLNILKISHPTLSVIANSDHLNVEWGILTTGKRICHCQVKYGKAVDKGTPEWVLKNTTVQKGDKGNMTVKEVESCSNYTFAVRCALDRAPWSDWSWQETVLTNLNKNDVKLRLWRKIAEADKHGVRRVHVMWKGIPSTCKGAFTYTIKQTHKDGKTGVKYADTLCGATPCAVDVNRDARRINLTVFHNGSLLVEDSVYVPAIGGGVPQVTDMQTSTLEGVILVSWTAPAQTVSGYVIDYTHDGNQYYWEETEYTNATLFDLLDKKTYNITVTPLFDDKTGHGTQALHICSRYGDPDNITITNTEANDKSALVSWNVKSQEECSGVVVNYTVFYSAQEGPELNVTVESTKQEILLKDLTPETEYSYYVEAIALTGATKSGKGIFKTKRFDPMLSTALSVCGGILIVLVLSLGLRCAVTWRNFKERPVPDPRNSSVALWPSTNKEVCPFQPFYSPSESMCVWVHTEEAQRTSTSPLATDTDDNSASDQTEEYADPVIIAAPNRQTENPAEPIETEQSSSSGESTELLPSENRQSSPYRSQSAVGTSTLRTSKQCQPVPVKPQEKKPPLAVYVTMHMFEQSQGR